MYKSPIQIIRFTAILVLVLVSCSCTSEMKKSRYLARAERYFKAGGYDQAKIEYLKVLKVDPNNAVAYARCGAMWADERDRKSTRLNSSHRCISYAVFCLKKKKKKQEEANLIIYNYHHILT